MERKTFIKNLLGASLFLSLDGFTALAGALKPASSMHTEETPEIAHFGAVHLNNTSLEKSIDFWTRICGLQLRSRTATEAELGTDRQTLVVVHETAERGFQEGYSGLYHFAIHLPDAAAFATALYRLQHYQYGYSPIDHTMTQSLYLKDPDGITIELALETPERFRRVIRDGGLFMEDVDGTLRPGSAPLNTAAVLKHLADTDLSRPISADAVLGHVHFYANDVARLNEFYRNLGFMQFNWFPEYLYADLGAGGAYQHRIAMNSWHGRNRPSAPAGSAGLRQYQITFRTASLLENAVEKLPHAEKTGNIYRTTDPTGNTVLLTLAV